MLAIISASGGLPKVGVPKIGGPSFTLSGYATSGSQADFPVTGNTSGIYYNPDNSRLGIVRNATKEVREYNNSDLSAVRTITLEGFNDSDIEGLCWMGGDEFAACSEGNSAYIIHIFDYPSGSSAATISPKQTLTVAAVGAGSNAGMEGVCYDQTNQIFYGVGEGKVSQADRKFYKVVRPVNTTTDYDYNDAELVVTEPFAAETALPETKATYDLAGITFHQSSGDVIIVSDLKARLIQLDPNGDGTIKSQLDLASGEQWEGVSFLDDDEIMVVSEPDHYQRYSK